MARDYASEVDSQDPSSSVGSGLPPGSPSGPPASRGVHLSWPPPGLALAQGALWQVTGYMGLGNLILVLPLLWSVGRVYPFYSLGPFGDGWWILIFTSFLGLLILMVALENLFSLFRSGRKAGKNGIPVLHVLQVASDRRRDMGFLLQGARNFSILSPENRKRLVQARIWAAVFSLAAALWVPVGFFLSVLLAARGSLSTSGIWYLTLAPVSVLLLAGLVAKGLEGTLLRGVYKGFSRDPWKHEEQQAAAAEWAQAARAHSPEKDQPKSAGGPGMGAGMVVVGLLAVFIAVPTFTLTLTNSVGPILASVAVPNFFRTQERAARAEVFRRYRLAPDPAVTPLEAGQALQALGLAGRDRAMGLLLEPACSAKTSSTLPGLTFGPSPPDRGVHDLMAPSGPSGPQWGGSIPRLAVG